MVKAVIKYTDIVPDPKNISFILSSNSIRVLRTYKGLSIYPEVTILVEDEQKLNELVKVMNENTTYGVQIKKATYIDRDKNFIIRLLKSFFK